MSRSAYWLDDAVEPLAHKRTTRRMMKVFRKRRMRRQQRSLIIENLASFNIPQGVEDLYTFNDELDRMYMEDMAWFDDTREQMEWDEEIRRTLDADYEAERELSFQEQMQEDLQNDDMDWWWLRECDENFPLEEHFDGGVDEDWDALDRLLNKRK